MFSILDYKITETVHERSPTIVYRALRQSDQVSVILKTFNVEFPTPKAILCLKHEYALLKTLNIKGVIKAFALEKWNNGLVLVLEDIKGDSLAAYLDERPLRWEAVSEIGIQVAENLNALHSQHIIHKDINPNNIIYEPKSKRIQLIDFSIATTHFQTVQKEKNPDRLEGSINYISPEQTGRINCPVDYRTDFYSFGITMYQALTGRLPFNSTNLMELVHCHIAKIPPPPHELITEIPEALAAIVMKCLAKTPEDRYQGAYGLKKDLESCLEAKDLEGQSFLFTPGQKDISNRFQIPQKLFGRDKEKRALMNVFESVRQGASELFVVSGDFGIGITSFVHDIHKSVTLKKGYFISGKFSPLEETQYSPLIQALKELAGLLLSEKEERLKRWKSKLKKNLGVNRGIILDFIPELKPLIVNPPSVPILPPAETQNRTNLVLLQFVLTFCSAQHPLVLFIDDLQWSKLTTLQFIEQLLTDSDSGHLLIIGAYHPDKVEANHQLKIYLEALPKANITIHQINLKPLGNKNITRIFKETLNCEDAEALALSEICLKKTGGNPFFIKQFLLTLFENKLVKLDEKGGFWIPDIQEAYHIEMSDNMVELLVNKIAQLPYKFQKILKLASCIGNRFDLHTLAQINEAALSVTYRTLWNTIQEGLIETSDISYQLDDNIEDADLENDLAQLIQENIHFTFSHDRIRQAAYSIINEADKKKIHLRIGQGILSRTAVENRGKILLNLVNQLNRGSELLSTSNETEQLAWLNLTAGKKAKVSTSFDTAYHYFQRGLSLLNENHWITDYNATLALHEEAAEAAKLCADFNEMERFIQLVLKFAKTILDKIKVYEIKIQAYMVQNLPQKAVETMLLVLELFEIKWSISPNFAQFKIEQLKTRTALIGKKPERLLQLPEMKDPEALAIIRILVAGGYSTLVACPELMPLIGLKSVQLSIKYGNSPQISTAAYACYGWVLSGVMGDVDEGYQFGQLAINLMEQSKITEAIFAKTHVFTESFFTHRKKHICETLDLLLSAYHFGLETGDANYARHAFNTYVNHAYLGGKPLLVLEAEIIKIGNTLNRFQQKDYFNSHHIFQQTISNLLDQGETNCQLTGKFFDEDKTMPFLLERSQKMPLFYLHFNKLYLFYLFGKPKEAVEQAHKAQLYIKSVLGTFILGSFWLYDSLARLSLIGEVKKSEKKRLFKQVKNNQKMLQTWAKHAPMNYSHKWMLVEAELYRLKNKPHQAEDYYEKAINLAKEHSFIYEEALAYELAALFYLSQAKTLIARTYMSSAHYAYSSWGAIAKTKDLEIKYPDLITTNSSNQTIRSSEIASSTTSIPLSTGTIQAMSMDLSSVKKASQSLSGEMILSELSTNLLKIMIENAGAQKGAIIVERSGQLTIEVLGGFDKNTIKVSPPKSNRSNQPIDVLSLPVSILQYVQQTNDTVLLNDTEIEQRFLIDPYIMENQPKSILCLPILHQGSLTSILYLENQLVAHAFPKHRLEILQLLSLQVAIAIENADLYTQLAQEGSQKGEDVYRQTLVDVMRMTLNCWEQATQKDKVQFAEESGIWSVHLDRSQLRTRALDRYLDIKKLPKNPRWREVVKSAYYVLARDISDFTLKQSLEQKLNHLLKIIHHRSL
jgi:predicted ATPase/GAF domain-containing protein